MDNEILSEEEYAEEKTRVESIRDSRKELIDSFQSINGMFRYSTGMENLAEISIEFAEEANQLARQKVLHAVRDSYSWEFYDTSFEDRTLEVWYQDHVDKHPAKTVKEVNEYERVHAEQG